MVTTKNKNLSMKDWLTNRQIQVEKEANQKPELKLSDTTEAYINLKN